MSIESASAGTSASRSALLGEHICIVVLNWNGWRDTIECLESLFRMDPPSYTVIVCDNGSSDNSTGQIVSWAYGNLPASCSSAELQHLSSPPVTKPINIVWYSSPSASLSAGPTDYSLVLIETGGNLGFAGGCNVGLRYALAQTHCKFVWLLNNDTVVERDALSKLVETMDARPSMGICGSVLRNYSAPQTVQALGGLRYNPWRGQVVGHVKSKLPGSSLDTQPIDYVSGASMLVRREFIDEVGLLDEGYFLYFEELDWARRASNRYSMGYAPLSFVYHKEGASIGTSSQRRTRSMLADRYATRNRLLFTRRFHRSLVPSVLGWVALTVFHRLLVGEFRKAGAIVLAAWDGLTCPKRSTHKAIQK